MASVKDVNIEETWKKALAEEFEKEYFGKIKDFLKTAHNEGKTIYPPAKLIFHAFDRVPLPAVKVVILGQDPYHGPGQAHGLSFSVPRTAKTPPSLRTIYKELMVDVEGFEKPEHGNLEKWADQGVFLLNAFLTVEHKKAGSHQKVGWGNFTDAVIQKISDEREGIIFMLWGNFAKKKAKLIDGSKHLILEAAHPSPLARDAYLGSKHFSQANAYLTKQGKETIDWILE
ncbi:MAG: uracil-DNA glycosylase [Aureispira sp.]